MQTRFYLAGLLLVLAGCAGPAAATDLSGDPMVMGRKVYVAKCAKCHKFYDPARYSDPEWSMWMEKMSRKAKLKPEQQQAVTQYINANLRPAQKEVPARQVPER